MTKTEKPSEATYFEWSRQILNVDFELPGIKNRFEANCQNAATAFQQTDFYQQVVQELDAWQIEYKASRAGSDLLMSGDEVVVVAKPYGSVVNKSYRKNILVNQSFPEPPEGGWITPDNWYQKFGDLIRTAIVCKFIDGPEFLVTKLVELAKKLNKTPQVESRSTEAGYYAYHFNAEFTLPLTDQDWNIRQDQWIVEIQLTTQLQEVLRKVLHGLYEEQRVDSDEPDSSWKWDFRSRKFRASYMGHTLHMLEAVIIDIREGKPS